MMNVTENGVLNLKDELEVHAEVLVSVGVLLLHGINVISMQAGFALLESGSVHKKHTKAILMKNLLDGALTGVLWFSPGYGLYTWNFQDFWISGPDERLIQMFTLYGFVATTCTIVSGAVVARMELHIYCATVCILVVSLFPFVGRMTWNEDGLLHNYFLDYAGGAVVHGAAGTFALVGAWFCGPRYGRFVATAVEDVSSSSSVEIDDNDRPARIVHNVKEMPASSPGMQVLGGFLLFFGWLSFNSMSGSLVGLEGLYQSALVAYNTLLGASVATLVGAFVLRYRTGYFDIGDTVNCMLAGLTVVTGGCGYFLPWHVVIIASLSATLFQFSKSFILHRLRIDDPLDASSLHGVIGFFGCIMTGIFHKEEGLIYTGSFQLLGRQLAGVGLIFGCSFVLAFTFYSICYKLNGNSISVADEIQIVGMDFELHDGYHMEDLDNQKVTEFNQYQKALRRLQRKNEFKASKTGQSSVKMGSAKVGPSKAANFNDI